MINLMRYSSTAIFSKGFRNKIKFTCKRASTSDAPDKKKALDCSIPPKPWVSYGFDYESEKEDTNQHHASFFFSVTLCLVWGSFMWAYAPDVHMRDWAQREAFLTLRCREKGGMLPVSPDFVDPQCIVLPSEEDLCEVEIII